jgi:hypothetical protein
MARILVAPAVSAVSAQETSLFLAGGITACEDWQHEICGQLRDIAGLVVFNPRREDYTGDVAGQIRWEWQHLRDAHAISFWFAAETVQPITLFELGRWTAEALPSGARATENDVERQRCRKTVFVGVHEEYSRRLDIEIQLRYQCPDLEIVQSIPALVEQIRNWAVDCRM